MEVPLLFSEEGFKIDVYSDEGFSRLRGALSETDDFCAQKKRAFSPASETAIKWKISTCSGGVAEPITRLALPDDPWKGPDS